jgi:hypothetical protein
MKARLVCCPVTAAPQVFRIFRLPVLLGRGEEVDVRVSDQWVSRRHCRLEERGGVLVVKDLGSTHGTWVNEQRVEEAELHPGDRLAIGLTTLTAEYRQRRDMSVGRVPLLPARWRAEAADAISSLLPPRAVPDGPTVRVAGPPPGAMGAGSAAIQAAFPPPRVFAGERGTCEPGFLVLVIGHILAALLGLALGYYIVCCLRPAEFNWWNLPVPQTWSANALPPLGQFDESLSFPPAQS